MFAKDIPRNEEGLLLFPRDQTFRAQHFVGWKEAGLEADHPAKANLLLTQELVRHTTRPGEKIMDITAGAGSILIALMSSRDVIAIDIAPHFVEWMKKSVTKIEVILTDMEIPISDSLILQGDCRNFLPLEVDSIIFSPPYAGAFNSGGGILSRDTALMASVEQYRHDPKNLGNLNDFLYNQAMDQIYQKCFESLPRGGKLSLLIKDRMNHGQRVPLGLAAVRSMMKAGFEVSEWHRWKPPGSIFVSIKRSKGEAVIEDEHIIIMEKPR